MDNEGRILELLSESRKDEGQMLVEIRKAMNAWVKQMGGRITLEFA